MKIEIKKFGTYLISRPEGRDAALVIRNQILTPANARSVELDFNEVKVLTPSWLDEVLQEIFKTIPPTDVQFLNTSNASVKASLEMVLSIK
ncbi:MAG: DUF4325 domain-containing protein [Bdellovibrio sp.]